MGNCIVSVSFIVCAATDKFTSPIVSKVSHDPAMGLVVIEVADINAPIGPCGIYPVIKRG